MKEVKLCIHNISKSNNIRALCSTAAAHGVDVIFVHSGDIFFENESGNILLGGKTVEIERFHDLNALKKVYSERGFSIVGIEIMSDAMTLSELVRYPGNNNIILMPGNEGTGLSAQQKAVCDAFVMINQTGQGTASLNVNVATSLVLNDIMFHGSVPTL